VGSRVLAPVLILAVALAACSSISGSPSPATTAAPATAVPGTAAPASPAATAAPTAASLDLTVYAAASLKKALATLKDAYEAANPGTTLTISTDSSTALATKIEQGAPADVFLSADTKDPQSLVDKGYGDGPVTVFAGNLLTVIVPTSNPAGIRSPADLARSGLKIITSADNVPIARYAAQLVANLAKEPGYPADFAAKYAANIASKEDNVSAVVSKIELGEGDAGVVYVTDAKGSDKVTAIPVPDSANVPVTYGGVVVKASPNAGAAGAFIAWLTGPDGQAILASLGFLAPAS
jgi:molybdate transport system substrate-binding protein